MKKFRFDVTKRTITDILLMWIDFVDENMDYYHHCYNMIGILESTQKMVHPLFYGLDRQL